VDALANALGIAGIVVMGGWMGYSALIYHRHRRSPSYYPYTAAAVLFGLAFAFAGDWVTASFCSALAVAEAGWQQARDQVEIERKLNRQIRDLGIEGIYMTPFDP